MEFLPKKYICADNTFQGDGRHGSESPESGTSREYGFPTASVTYSVMKLFKYLNANTRQYPIFFPFIFHSPVSFQIKRDLVLFQSINNAS